MTGYLPQRTEIRFVKTHVHPRAHRSMVPDRGGAARLPECGRTDQENATCAHNGIIFSLEKRRKSCPNTTTAGNPDDILLSEEKPVTEGQRSHDATYRTHVSGELTEAESGRADVRGGRRDVAVDGSELSVTQDVSLLGTGCTTRRWALKNRLRG